MFVAAACILTGACSMLARKRVSWVRKITQLDQTSLLSALRQVPACERANELARRTRPGSWEHNLAAALLAAHDGEGTVSAVNGSLAEVERDLARGNLWPRAALRIAAAGGLLLAVFAFFGNPASLEGPLCIIAIATVAAGLCLDAARTAERDAKTQRRVIDVLVAVTLGFHDEGEAPHWPRPRGAWSSKRLSFRRRW